MSTKEETKSLSLWQRFKKTALTIAVVVSLLWSFTNQLTIEEFKATVGPIGTNPLQLNPTKFISAEVGSENMHPGNPSSDSLVGINYSSRMFTRIHKNDLGFATTSALANYALNSSLNNYVPTSRTITINGTPFDLSANRSWTISGTTYSAGSGLSLVGTTFANTAPDQVVSFTGNNGLVFSGTYPNFSLTQKRRETYSGTTNASGVYTVTFGTAYSIAPNIQANIINGADNQNLRITSISTTGFTVLARTRVDVAGLLPTWNNATGLGIDVLITEK